MLRPGIAVLAFILPMASGLWTAKQAHMNELIQLSETASARSVELVDDLIDFASQANQAALLHRDLSCDLAFPELRAIAAFKPFLSSVNLVKEGSVNCSSLLGSTQLTDVGAFTGGQLSLVSGGFVRSNVPLLIVRSTKSTTAALAVIEGSTIQYMLKLTGSRTQGWLHIGNAWLDANGEYRTTPPLTTYSTISTTDSKKYPYAVHTGVNTTASWYEVMEDQRYLLQTCLLLSLLLAGAVYSSVGRPRSLYTELAHGLRAAEFVPYFQPVMDRDGKRIIGTEVLMRWHHPSGVLIRPDQFIPLAEESGLICDMTVQMMRKVADLLVCRIELLPKGFHVAFNISATHCKDNALLHECTRFLSRFPTGSVQLVLELTERQLFMDDDHVLTLFKRLNELGVKLAIDDFGTGNSTHAYLQSFHIDFLKIDRSFVNLIGKESVSSHIIENLIDLANRLNQVIVAEGVETREQAEYLASRGVHLLQGYLFGKPVPFDVFIKEHNLTDLACKDCTRCSHRAGPRKGCLTQLRLRKEGL